MNSILEAQALRSAAFLVAALADRRFGARALSDELKDAVSVLRSELDSLGLLTEYQRPDGSLAAWRPEDDAYSREVLRRASFKDNQSSDPAYLYRVML